VALLTSLVKTYSDPFYIFSGGNLIINKTVPPETNTKQHAQDEHQDTSRN